MSYLDNRSTDNRTVRVLANIIEALGFKVKKGEYGPAGGITNTIDSNVPGGFEIIIYSESRNAQEIAEALEAKGIYAKGLGDRVQLDAKWEGGSNTYAIHLESILEDIREKGSAQAR